MNKTGIEYLDYTWNPTKGCTKISEGCLNCWAEKRAKMLALAGIPGYDKEDPFAVKCFPERLEEPLKVKKPSIIGVSFMGDLFHENVSFEFISDVFKIIHKNHQNTFVILTKRPDRLRNFYHFSKFWDEYHAELKNLWLGVTAENQEQADKRIPILLSIPAAKHFVSCEPILDEIDLKYIAIPYNGGCNFIDSLNCEEKADDCGEIGNATLSWVICGAESGPNSRDTFKSWEWAKSLKDQCDLFDVPFFYKQGFNDNAKWVKMPVLDGKIWDQKPEGFK